MPSAVVIQSGHFREMCGICVYSASHTFTTAYNGLGCAQRAALGHVALSRKVSVGVLARPFAFTANGENMWIESHQSLRSHPKVKKAARLAGINEFEMIGRLHCLWWWALDYAPDGDISKYSADDIEDAVDWSGQRGVLYKSLLDCGFNGHRGLIEKFDDGSIHIHDWMEYGGKLLEQRELNSERARRKRELYDDMRLTRAVKSRDKNTCRYCGIEVDWADRKGKNGGTYDHVDPEGQNTEDNIVVSCRSCNSKKNRRTPEQAGMELITVDNLPEIRLKSGNNLLLQNRTEQTEDNRQKESADKPRTPRTSKAKEQKDTCPANWMTALYSLCGVDAALASGGMRKRISEAGRALIASGANVEDVERFGQWWIADEWRRKNTPTPTPEQVRDQWGKMSAGAKLAATAQSFVPAAPGSVQDAAAKHAERLEARAMQRLKDLGYEV